MKATHRALRLAAVLGLLVGARPGWCAAKEPAPGDEQAREVLDAAGISGGLILHVGCDAPGGAELTAALGRSARFIVRGLAQDERAVAEARKRIAATGAYGRASVGLWRGGPLPCTDNLANLIVCEKASELDEADAMRALAPRGVLLVRKGDGGWVEKIKPWPREIDEWTHFLHGPDNNAVAADSVVGPPVGLQWIADPIHLRSHEHLNGVTAVVSARGRVFYIIDEGPTAAVVAQPKWQLIARDAFNGVLLWKRDIGPWEGHFRLFRSGPPETPRRLVAIGEEVYATLGYGKEVAAFDAATGRTLRTYEATKGALEIVADEGRLFVVVGDIDTSGPTDPARPYTATPAPRRKGIVAVDAATGRVLWTRRDKDAAALMPTTLAVSGGRAFFQNTRQIVCLDAPTGREKWRSDRPVYTTRLSWSTPILVVRDGVVLSADGSTGGLPGAASKGEDQVKWTISDRDIRRHPTGDLVALSAETGKQLWTGKTVQGFCNPGDLFVVGDRVWAGANVGTGQAALDSAVDLRTGHLRSSRPNNGLPVGGHTKCYRDKATERFLLLGGIGVEFVDLTDWSWNANLWVRGSCQYGVMPCNGLLYAPPDSCACRPEQRLHGFTAMAPKRPPPTLKDNAPDPLTRGGAYAAVRQRGKGPSEPSPAWPTYRNDGARSGCTSLQVPARLQRAWRTEIGGKLTSVTAGEGKVFVSRLDAHTVYALDLPSGGIAWQRTVGGPVDSPPTLYRGLVIFGCRDGQVYCLRADDGELAWRFRAAPDDRFLVAMESVESAWPIHGSVLVHDGLAWFAAGRSPYLDGGIRLYALDAVSGKVVVTSRIDARGPEKFQTARPAGGIPADRTAPMLPDILSASDGLVYMRWMGFDAKGQISQAVKPHLFSATGFLDGTWWHRTYWQYGTWMRGGFGGWPQAARVAPAGRLMVIGDDALFSFGREKYDPGNPNDVHAGHVGVVKNTYQDEGRIDHSRNRQRLFSCGKPVPDQRKAKGSPAATYNWRMSVPMLVRGMVLADRTLFVAGPAAGRENRGLGQLATPQPGLLWAVNAADGKKLAECELPAAPVHDGMAAMHGGLLVSCVDGSVVSLDGRKE